MKSTPTIASLVLVVFGVVACQSDSASVSSGEDEPAQSTEKTATDVVPANVASPGKLGAPINITYEVIGNPIVGVPVAVNVVITSDHSPLSVSYSIDDSSALLFQDGQVESLDIVDATSGSVQQVSVVPQREGRLYINVSAEVPTELGTMIRSIAIPIKVGSAPKQTTANGELKTGPDGEEVISMPAEQTNK